MSLIKVYNCIKNEIPKDYEIHKAINDFDNNIANEYRSENVSIWFLDEPMRLLEKMNKRAKMNVEFEVQSWLNDQIGFLNYALKQNEIEIWQAYVVRNDERIEFLVDAIRMNFISSKWKIG